MAGRPSLYALLGLTELFQFGERLVSGIAALLFGRIDQLVEVAGVKVADTIHASGVLLVGIARVRAHADHVPLFLAGLPQRRFADEGAADVGRIVKRAGHREKNLVFVVSREDIGILLRLLAAAAGTAGQAYCKDRKQTGTRRNLHHRAA